MTGQCYDISFARLPEMLQKYSSKRVRLCHGIPTLTRAPFKPYGHAWLEVAVAPGVVLVFDPSREMPVWQALYYRAGKIQYVKRYTAQEALLLSVEFETTGPWDETVSAALHTS